MSRIRQGGFGRGRITPPAVNLARNPWPADVSGLTFMVGGPVTVVASGGPFGGPFVRLTHTSASATSNSDFLQYGDPSWVAGSGSVLPGAIPVRPGDVHTWSLYVRLSRANELAAQCQYTQGAGAASGTATGSLATPVANTWTRLPSVTATAGADAQALRCDVDVGSAINWQVGDTVDVACLMISQGPTLLPFSVGQHREL